MFAPPSGASLVTRWWAGGYGLTGELLYHLLAPAEGGYRAVMAWRNHAYDRGLRPIERLPVPVVSVGNLAVGGAGKTPVAAWVATRLAARGHAPAILHGGYGADEPELHRRWNPDVPVHVGRDRRRSGRRAVAQGATALVLDDGFQHRGVARDVDLVLIAAESWTAPARLLPRGAWRESPRALRRATHVAITRKICSEEAAADVARRVAVHTDAPLTIISLRPAGWRRGDGLASAPVAPAVAVAAIANAELFAASAREAGAEVAEVIAYPDHHAYGAADGRRILEAARGRPIVTTEKDWIKLAAFLDQGQVWMLLQRLELEEGAEALQTALARLGR